MAKRLGRARPMTHKLARLRESSAFSTHRLAADLAEAYDVQMEDRTGHVLLHAWGEERYVPPIRIVFSDEALRQHLRSMAGDAADLFPDVPPVQAAYQLFLVHIDEEIATSAVPGSAITLGSDGMVVDPAREIEQPPDLDPGGAYHWSAEPGVTDTSTSLEFMSPEQYAAKYGRAPDVPPAKSDEDWWGEKGEE